jgi:hypothetical protein
MSTGTGVLEAVRIDLERLHAAWMELVFERQLEPVHPTLGKWRPETGLEHLVYWPWALLGLLALLVGYPLVVVGFTVRVYAGRIRTAAVATGLLGVVVLTAVIWGLLTLATYLAAFPWEGVVAVGVGGGVATVSAALALLFTRLDGRAVTVLLAYPFALTAIFLPPVVAAFYSPTLADVVFPNSDVLATWILDNLLAFWGLAAFLRATFSLVGIGYIAMWLALSFPIGWLLGLVVSLANLVRPGDRSASS